MNKNEGTAARRAEIEPSQPDESEDAGIEQEQFTSFFLPAGVEVKIKVSPESDAIDPDINKLMQKINETCNNKKTLSATEWLAVLDDVSQIYEIQGTSDLLLSNKALCSALLLHEAWQEKNQYLQTEPELDFQLLDAQIAAEIKNLQDYARYINHNNLLAISENAGLDNDMISVITGIIEEAVKKNKAPQTVETEEVDDDDDGSGAADEEEKKAGEEQVLVEENVVDIRAYQERIKPIIVNQEIRNRIEVYFKGNQEILDIMSMHKEKPVHIGRLQDEQFALVLWTGNNEAVPHEAIIIRDPIIVRHILQDRFYDLHLQPRVRIKNLPPEKSAIDLKI